MSLGTLRVGHLL